MDDQLQVASNGREDRIGISVARFMPAGISRFDVKALYNPEGDLRRVKLDYEGPFGERVSTLAIMLPRDPRPICDEVPLLIDAGAPFGGHYCDLISWCFADTGRVVSLPMEPIFRLMLADPGKLSFMGRLEKGVCEWQARYVTWERVWFALLDLRAAIAPYLRVRGHIEAPEGVAFCRLPGCDQMARYPGSPKRPVWCWRHYEMSRGNLPMPHETLTNVRKAAKSDRARYEEGVAAAPIVDEEAEREFEMSAW